MPERERRKGYERPLRAMERELTDEQVVMLRQLESYGWELKFIRHVPFQAPPLVLFDSDRSHYAVLLRRWLAGRMLQGSTSGTDWHAGCSADGLVQRESP